MTPDLKPLPAGELFDHEIRKVLAEILRRLGLEIVTDRPTSPLRAVGVREFEHG